MHGMKFDAHVIVTAMMQGLTSTEPSVSGEGIAAERV